MIHLLRLLRIVGLSARVTRLVTTDVITQDLRARVLHLITYDPGQRKVLRRHSDLAAAAVDRGEDPPKLVLPKPLNPRAAQWRLKAAKLVTCNWCAGFWVAVLVTAVDQAAGERRWFRFVSEAATAAHAVGWLAGRERD